MLDVFNSFMKELVELVEILNPNKLKEVASLRDVSNSNTRIAQLYNTLYEERELSEELLVERLFGQGDRHRSNYNRIKRQLKERLINSLFLVDANKAKYLTMAQAHNWCYKNTAAVKILLGKKARNSAISIAEETYKVAEKFEFTDVLLNLSKDLRVHYGNVGADEKKYLYYNQKTKYYTEVFLAELKAEEYFSELSNTFAVSKSSKSEFKEKAKIYAEELELILKRFHSYRLNLFGYTVIAYYYEMSHDYLNTIDTCDMALNYFESRNHLANKTARYTFYFRKVASLILLGQLEKALITTETCLVLEKPGLHNWYITQIYRFIIFLHSKQYTKTYDVYKEAIEHPNFTKQYPSVKETWYIYEAYTYFFFLKNAIDVPLNDRLKKFRLNKFLNEIPGYSKDKRGMNISVLILQILFLLHQKEYGKIIDRVEALRTYTHRYLRKDATFRSNCFIKMLLQLPNANFHKAAVERKTADLRKKLSSVGIINNQSAEVEIVPYEVLWEFVLDSLEYKIY